MNKLFCASPNVEHLICLISFSPAARQSYVMLRSKHSASYSLLRYGFNRKVTYYLLLLLFSLSVASVLLIIFYGYGIIAQSNVVRLTFLKRSTEQIHELEGLVDVVSTTTTSTTNRRLRDWHTLLRHIPRDQRQPKLKIGQSTITNSTTTTNLWPEFAKKRYVGSPDNGLKLTGFNVKLSESLPLQRLVPDTRHKK